MAASCVLLFSMVILPCPLARRVKSHLASSRASREAPCIDGYRLDEDCLPSFEYRGDVVTGCTKKGAFAAWCSHDSVHRRSSNRWSYCSPCSPTPPPAPEDDPKNAILAGMARCWQPSPDDKPSYSDAGVQGKMLAELDDYLYHNIGGPSPSGEEKPLDLHPDATMSPLQVFGPLGSMFPHHYSAGLTQSLDEPRSHCFNFDYSFESHADIVDPAGCGFFKKSFQPMQELERCVEEKVTSDPYYQFWNEVMGFASREDGDEDSQTQFGLKLSEELGGKLPAEVLEATALGEEIEKARNCQGPTDCMTVRPFDRTMEILKRSEYDSWEGLETKDVVAKLRRKILHTFTTPPDTQTPALSEETIDNLVRGCFKVDIDGPSTPGLEARTIKESMRCVPLMWDRLEIPGKPQMPLAPAYGKPKQLMSFPFTHPICGRIALAGIVKQFVRARYPTGTRLLEMTFGFEVTDAYCFAPEWGQCQNFQECWELALTKHAKKINAFCEVTEVVDNQDSSFIEGGIVRARPRYSNFTALQGGVVVRRP